MKVNTNKIKKTLNLINQIKELEKARKKEIDDIYSNGYKKYLCKNEGEVIELLRAVRYRYNPKILRLKEKIIKLGFKVSTESYDEEITIYELEEILKIIILY